MNILDELKDAKHEPDTMRVAAKELRQEVGLLVNEKIALIPGKVQTYMEAMYGANQPKIPFESGKKVIINVGASPIVGPEDAYVDLNVDHTAVRLQYVKEPFNIWAIAWRKGVCNDGNLWSRPIYADPQYNMKGVRVVRNKLGNETKIMLSYGVKDRGMNTDLVSEAATQLIQTGTSTVLETIVEAHKLLDSIIQNGDAKAKKALVKLVDYK